MTRVSWILYETGGAASNHKADHGAVLLHIDYIEEEKTDIWCFMPQRTVHEKELTVLRNMQGRMPGKRKVKMLAAGKILEAAEDPRE